MSAVSPRDVARVVSRARRARIEQVGAPGSFVVGCVCGWSIRANGRAQASALKSAHDRGHVEGRAPRRRAAGGAS